MSKKLPTDPFDLLCRWLGQARRLRKAGRNEAANRAGRRFLAVRRRQEVMRVVTRLQLVAHNGLIC